MADGKPRDIEGEIETDDRGAQLVAVFEKYVFYEIRCAQQFEPFRSGEAGKNPLIVLRQRRATFGKFQRNLEPATKDFPEILPINVQIVFDIPLLEE